MRTVTDHERRAADVIWDVLAELGLQDSRGGAEYRREFADPERVYEFSQAAFSVVGRLMLAGAGRIDVASEENRP